MERNTQVIVDHSLEICSSPSSSPSPSSFFASSSRPDMTFAIDWALSNNYLSLHHPLQHLINTLHMCMILPMYFMFSCFVFLPFTEHAFLPCVCADLRRRFQRIPMSTRVAVEASVELQCLPPEGKPLPRVRRPKLHIAFARR